MPPLEGAEGETQLAVSQRDRPPKSVAPASGPASPSTALTTIPTPAHPCDLHLPSRRTDFGLGPDHSSMRPKRPEPRAEPHARPAPGIPRPRNSSSGEGTSLPVEDAERVRDRPDSTDNWAKNSVTGNFLPLTQCDIIWPDRRGARQCVIT